jgi:uncharacterized protein (DUF1778 family)
MAEERTERIALRLTPQEADVVNAIAEETGLSVSDVVRQAIRQAYADRFKKQKR